MRDRHLHEVRIAEEARAVEIGAAHRLDLAGAALRRRRQRPSIFRSKRSSMFSISISATPPELGGGIDDDVVAAERARDRRALLRLVAGEVFLGDQAAVGRHVLGDAIGDPALVEHVRRRRWRWRAASSPRSVEHQTIPAAHCAAARLAVGGDRRRDTCPSRRTTLRSFEARARGRAEIDEALLGELHRRHHHVLPRQLAEALVRERETADGARHARREIALRWSARCRPCPSRMYIVRVDLQRRLLAVVEGRHACRWRARTTMKPPPPMLPALGCVTASANAVATAASTAMPPLARTAAPASQAGADVQTTSPSFDEHAVVRRRGERGRGRKRSSDDQQQQREPVVKHSSAAAYHRSWRLARLRWAGLAGSADACRSGQASRFPLGATFDGRGTNFSLFSEAAHARRAVSVRRRGQGDARPPARSHRALLARLLARTSARAALRLPRPRPVGARRWAVVQSGEAAAGSLREGDRRRVELERGAVPVPLRRARHLEERPRQRAVHARSRWSSIRSFDWGSDAPPRTPWHKTIVYETHVKGFTKRTPALPEDDARHLRRPGASRRRSST